MSSKTVIFTRLYRKLHRNVGIIFIGFFLLISITLKKPKIFDFIYKIDEMSLKKKKSIDLKIIKEVLGE